MSFVMYEECFVFLNFMAILNSINCAHTNNYTLGGTSAPKQINTEPCIKDLGIWQQSLQAVCL